MVKNRHNRPGHAPAFSGPIREVRFRNPRLESLGLDTLTVAQLRQKASPEYFARPERLEFYQLIYFTAGRGAHLVDFRRYGVKKGTLIAVRPKQVQQFYLNPSLQGRLLLIDPVFLGVPRHKPAEQSLLIQNWPSCLDLPPPLGADVAHTFEIVARETACYQGDALTARFLRHLVLALLLEIQRFAGRSLRSGDVRAAGARPDVARLLQEEVEAAFCRERSVKYYAQRLGYSEKTLTRACLAAGGCTAKAMIDQRVALEAKRLLAHSDSSCAAIAAQLGFSEATNFVKFFKRVARLSPSAFRTRFLPPAALASFRLAR